LEFLLDEDNGEDDDSEDIAVVENENPTVPRGGCLTLFDSMNSPFDRLGEKAVQEQGGSKR